MATNEKLSVKRLPFYLFLILLGFLLFYVFDYVRGDNNSAGDSSGVKSGATKIDEKTAKEYMSHYLEAQKSIGEEYKISTRDGQTLRGFWISKKTLQEIDESIKKSGDPRDVIGYSIYFGKTESYERGRKQVLNLVVRGSLPNENYQPNTKTTMMKLTDTDSPIEDAGDYFDTIDPCPIHCGSAEPEEEP